MGWGGWYELSHDNDILVLFKIKVNAYSQEPFQIIEKKFFEISSKYIIKFVSRSKINVLKTSKNMQTFFNYNNCRLLYYELATTVLEASRGT